MAADLRSLAAPPNPNPRVIRAPFSSSSSSSLFFRPAALRLDPTRFTLLSTGCLGDRIPASTRRFSRLLPLAASHEESKHLDIEIEKEKNQHEAKTREPEEVLMQMLEDLKRISVELYAMYSKKAMVILKETSEKLKIEADKASHDLAILAKKVSEDGRVYLDSSPDYVKEVVEAFSSIDNLKDMSKVRDFYVGIPYGSFLAIGGLLLFMLTGSISAIRFGLILGAALLYLSYLSLKSWKSGQWSETYLKGQIAIAAIIYIKEWRLFLQRRSFSSSLMILISGAVLAFYIYRILHDSNKGESLKHSSEK